MSARFDVMFAGELLEGCDAATVRGNLGRLFKADEATLDKLFSGKPQILKRDADEATARKYQQALQNAGAKPLLRPCADAAVAGTTPPPAATAQQSGLTLAPPGTEVLGPGERASAVAPSVEAPSLDVAAAGERLADPAPPAPPAPDTSHLTLGAVGETIPGLSGPPPSPVTVSADLALAPEGGDLSDCAPPQAPAPALDLSKLELAAAGADVLEERYRKRDTAAAPDTSRLSLED